MLVCGGGCSSQLPPEPFGLENGVVGTHMFFGGLGFMLCIGWKKKKEVVTVAFTLFILRPVSLVFFFPSYPLMRTTTAKFIAQLYFQKPVDDKYPF